LGKKKAVSTEKAQKKQIKKACLSIYLIGRPI
jgi:hypothetical protein